MAASTNDKSWQDDIYDLLKKAGVTQVSYVPDAGHRAVIDKSIGDPDMHSIALTTEEEGVGVACGAWLGGEKSVLLVQSSGVGNCVNFFSLIPNGGFPFLMMVSMRGEFGEGNRWQVPMGQAVQPVLEACGIKCLRVETPEEVIPTLEAGLTMAYQAGQAVAILLTQKLIGAKKFF